MDIKDTKLYRIGMLYLRKKDKETALKKREEQINGIVKILMVGKTPNQSISMLKEVTQIFNDKLDEELRVSLEKVNQISAYKKLKK